MEMLYQPSNLDMPQSGLQTKSWKILWGHVISATSSGTSLVPSAEQDGDQHFEAGMSPPTARQEGSCTYSCLKNNVTFHPHYVSPQPSQC